MLARRLPVIALAAVASFAAAATRAQPVQVEPLASVDVFTTGAATTGLAADLWRGASAPLVAAALKVIADKPLPPAAAMLARRVLATGATAPEGAAADQDLAGARALALIALGDAPGAARMLANAVNVGISAPLAQAAAEARLIGGDRAGACATEAALKVGRDAPYWLTLRAWCQALAGDAEAGELTFALAREAGRDPVFTRLMGARLGARQAAGAASLRGGLDLALSRDLGLDLAAALDDASPAVAAVLARDGSLPAAVRRAAAARALRGALTLADLSEGGALPLDPVSPPGGPDLRAVDTSVPVENVIAALAPKPGVAAEGYLAGYATGQSDPGLRERATLALLGRAKTAADAVALARLARPALARLARDGGAVTAPLVLARAAALAGDAVAAEAFRARLGEASARDLALLDPMIAAAAGRADSPGLDRLVERAARPGADAALQSAALIVLALGEPLSPQARLEAAGLGPPPAAGASAKLVLMERAADAGATGECALLAIWASVEAGPVGPTPPDRARIIRALRKAGLDADARAFAVEGLGRLE